MDPMLPEPAGAGTPPDAWGDVAQLATRVVAREHPQKWAATGLPDSLATLDTPIETVWAAVQLALSGANQHTVASTLDLSEDCACHIIVATTEHLVTGPQDAQQER
jgi:hypothetical protein